MLARYQRRAERFGRSGQGLRHDDLRTDRAGEGFPRRLESRPSVRALRSQVVTVHVEMDPGEALRGRPLGGGGRSRSTRPFRDSPGARRRPR